jgi:hypothetical protein
VRCGPISAARWRGAALPIRRCLLSCRFCCKSLFALVIKISFGCTRDFRVNMWGTSLPEDKLAGDLGNVIGATFDRRSSVGFFYSKKNRRRAI